MTWPVLAEIIALALLLWWGAARLRAWRRSLVARRRARVALQGQQDATALLAAHGYEVVAGQTRHQLIYGVDDREHMAILQCDYVVERDGELLVAEVKTGAIATQLSTAATRRQMLEYQVAFGVPGIVLVDMERGTCAEVRFTLRAQAASCYSGG